ncbi:MAG: hypothetical protein LBL83_12020 [Clostridiales bacterium]|jgi:hypothetical protein|nr:hypothetical protein [Clostridiales bacterium]
MIAKKTAVRLYFRNALLNNKDIADECGKLKMRLVEEVNGDRVLCTDSKTEFHSWRY